VLEGLEREGFRPFEVRQGGSRDEAKRGGVAGSKGVGLAAVKAQHAATAAAAAASVKKFSYGAPSIHDETAALLGNEKAAAFAPLRPWYKELLALNENEGNTAEAYPEEFYAHYLATCVY
jgi:hypothetical protein